MKVILPGKRKARRGGGRVHDPVFGVRCHWCRQKTIEDHVACACCPLRFCGSCLLNRHGEDIRMEMKSHVRWVCPRCRGGCGPGCKKNCCNCGPCRKTQRLEPTGQLIRVARGAGFNNVHDYLVHLKTGETPVAIASRKEGHGWTSIDSLGVMAAVMEERNNVAWAKKRIRSIRWCVANSRWGNQTTSSCHEQIQTVRLIVARLNIRWDVGRKLKSRCPQFLTENQIFRD